jgi:hypothetical protein
MRHAIFLVLAAGFVVLAVGCNEDSPVRPSDELTPPTNLTFVTGELTVDLTWARSPYEPAGDFAGYNVYVDTVSIAGLTDTTSAATLDARKVNANPITTRSYRVLNLGNGAPLEVGRKYFFHVRAARDDDRVSEASNEVDTAPRPAGDNNFENDPMLWMHDYDVASSTRSGFGWDRDDGDGLSYATALVNRPKVDLVMLEEPNSADDGSEFVSPDAATIVENDWADGANTTKIMDLGAGETAWNTSIAPDTAGMGSKVKIYGDHTYALYTHDGYWAKVRVVTYQKNQSAQGTTAKLNRVRFDWAFQLVNDYGRFKPVPGPTR